MRKRRKPANDNRRPTPYGALLVVALVAMWFLIIQGIAAVLKAIFG